MRELLREAGQTQAEYGVVLTLVAVAAAAMFVLLGDRVIATLDAVLSLLS